MSSLQKFHRRTNSGAAPLTYPTLAIGTGDADKGWVMGATGTVAGVKTHNLWVCDKNTFTSIVGWGSPNVLRNATSEQDGLANTNILYAFGASSSTGHPPAYALRSLTTGGYNTWYMPSLNELKEIAKNMAALPAGQKYPSGFHGSSTEINAASFWRVQMGTANTTTPSVITDGKTTGELNNYRAVRRSV
jgi:hypothetical protein